MAALGVALAAGACGSDEGGSGSGSASASASASASGTGAGAVETATGPGLKPAAVVRLEPTTFEPDKVAIPAGKRVLWKWAGGVQHNVKGDGFKSELMSKGEFAHTFDTAGTFEYVCDVHPTTMKGTVEVTES